MPQLLLILCLALATLTAPATPPTFTNPVALSGGDPWVIQHQGWYYYCQSRKGTGVYVSKTQRLEELGQAAFCRVWRPPFDTEYSKEIWAPELHYLRGQWYIYVAADDGDNNHHRMYVLQGTTQDPQDPFVFKGKLNLPEDRWAIDGTVVTIGEKLYFIWSGWEGDQNVAQNLYIAAMSDPLTVTGPRTCISRPEHAWEKHGEPFVNEGPEALWHNDQLFIIYSASGSWGDDYCLGQLQWTGGDPLRPESWVKKPEPVFSRTAEVFGPGHCSFVKSPDGKQDWIVYHAAKHSGAGWSRNIRIQPFSWTTDGAPYFGSPIAAGIPLPVPSRSEPARTNAPTQ